MQENEPRRQSGETVDQYRLRKLEDHRDEDLAILMDVRDTVNKMTTQQNIIANSAALKVAQSSTLRVAMISAAVIAVLGGVITVAISIINAGLHLATTGVPTP